jgi:hypothetical protein
LITEVVLNGDFEATLSWVIGLQRRLAFGVLALAEPSRVVVDVRVPEAGGLPTCGAVLCRA